LEVTPDERSLRRDLGVFLPCFAAGIGLGLIDSTSIQIAGAVALLIAYGAYARRTVRHSGESEDVEELKPLRFDPTKEDPPHNIAIVVQVVVGLVMIVGGAELFVEEVVTLAEALGISALVLSLVLAPLATELPEKLNSVLWMRRDKGALR
jgi:cation:H+ antiporter